MSNAIHTEPIPISDVTFEVIKLAAAMYRLKVRRAVTTGEAKHYRLVVDRNDVLQCFAYRRIEEADKTTAAFLSAICPGLLFRVVPDFEDDEDPRFDSYKLKAYPQKYDEMFNPVARIEHL